MIADLTRHAPSIRLFVCFAILSLSTMPTRAENTDGFDATGADQAPELTEEASEAIDRGLKWLIATQNADGSWANDTGKFPIAATSLALTAFMVEGHFPGFGPYGEALDRGKEYLLKRIEESPSGSMGVKMYEVGFFTTCLAELWGMTKDPADNQRIQTALERIVEVILRSQNPLGGWRYVPRPDAGQDTSVTMTVFVSLASARESGILVPTESINRVTEYLRDQVWDEKTGGFGYQGPGYTLSCTAGGAYAAQLAGNRGEEWVEAALDSLENNPKMFSRKDNGYFYYSHYYAMQA
ncbi:MAG: prenyltransferase/squalene oxidase repeat-containing protein, partial [Phycisphaeraceae bacterium]